MMDSLTRTPAPIVTPVPIETLGPNCRGRKMRISADGNYEKLKKKNFKNETYLLLNLLFVILQLKDLLTTAVGSILAVG